MRKIWKYDLPVKDEVSIDMPKGAEIISVQEQAGMVMWSLCDPVMLSETRRFKVIGTGHSIQEPIGTDDYIGTVQTHGGALVWHIFELVP